MKSKEEHANGHLAFWRLGILASWRESERATANRPEPSYANELNTANRRICRLRQRHSWMSHGCHVLAFGYFAPARLSLGRWIRDAKVDNKSGNATRGCKADKTIARAVTEASLADDDIGAILP